MCQHKYLHELGIERWYLNCLKYILINVIYKYRKNKRERYKSKFIPNKINFDYEVETFLPGEIVRIKSRDDILKTLNFHGKFNKVQFLDEMFKYCGKEYRILIKVNYSFDDVLGKIGKCKNLYILEGLSCQGIKDIFQSMCDLNCYYFWHAKWLSKID